MDLLFRLIELTSGIQALHLEVESSNKAALGLYCRLGFEEHDKRYLMSKSLERDN